MVVPSPPNTLKTSFQSSTYGLAPDDPSGASAGSLTGEKSPSAVPSAPMRQNSGWVSIRCPRLCRLASALESKRLRSSSSAASLVVMPIMCTSLCDGCTVRGASG